MLRRKFFSAQFPANPSAQNFFEQNFEFFFTFPEILFLFPLPIAVTSGGIRMKNTGQLANQFLLKRQTPHIILYSEIMAHFVTCTSLFRMYTYSLHFLSYFPYCRSILCFFPIWIMLAFIIDLSFVLIIFYRVIHFLW
jgi:hypothetical protein